METAKMHYSLDPWKQFNNEKNSLRGERSIACCIPEGAVDFSDVEWVRGSKNFIVC